MTSIINSIRIKLVFSVFICCFAVGVVFVSTPLLAEEVEEITIEEEDLSYKEMLHRDKIRLKELQVEQKRRDKLNIIEKKEEQRSIQSQTSALIREGKIAYSKRQYDEAREAFYSILDIDPQNKTALKFLKLIRTRIDKEKGIALRRKTENLYREGIKNYKAKDYEAAIDNFLEVNNLIPDYKKANYYLDKAEKGIKKERFRQQELGLDLEEEATRREEVVVEEEVEVIEEVEIIEPREEEVIIEEQEEVEIKEEVVLRQTVEEEEVSQTEQEVEALLEEAKTLYSDQMNNAAREKFEEVLAIDADNRIALNYIDIIDGKAEVEQITVEEEKIELK